MKTFEHTRLAERYPFARHEKHSRRDIAWHHFTEHTVMRHHRYQYIDPFVMFKAVGGDLDAFRSLSKIFLEIAPPMLERLERNILADDGNAALHDTHSLKGTTVLVGAVQLTCLLKDIESRLREDVRSAVPHLPELTQLFQLAMQEVQISITDFQGDRGGNAIAGLA